ncbi:hypothetical protein HK101_010432 [Irineochytrium annulatum]|nr:hypothetical protein HK101_010432 [Irineochytrium annulatum]
MSPARTSVTPDDFIDDDGSIRLSAATLNDSPNVLNEDEDLEQLDITQAYIKPALPHAVVLTLADIMGNLSTSTLRWEEDGPKDAAVVDDWKAGANDQETDVTNETDLADGGGWEEDADDAGSPTPPSVPASPMFLKKLGHLQVPSSKPKSDSLYELSLESPNTPTPPSPPSLSHHRSSTLPVVAPFPSSASNLRPQSTYSSAPAPPALLQPAASATSLSNSPALPKSPFTSTIKSSPHSTDTGMRSLAQSLVRPVTLLREQGSLSPWDAADLLTNAETLIHLNARDRSWSRTLLGLGVSFLESALASPEGSIAREVAVRDAVDFFEVLQALWGVSHYRAKRFVKQLEGGWYKKGIRMEELAESIQDDRWFVAIRGRRRSSVTIPGGGAGTPSLGSQPSSVKVDA